MSHDRLEELLAQATVVVCHGGPGTVTEARDAGHVPLCMPRDPELGEHVDDHQQRFAALDFTYPEAEVETEIVVHEAGIDRKNAAALVRIAQRTRNLKGHGLDEGASTRMLIQAGRLMSRSVPIVEACEVALVLPITDDPDMRMALSETIAACI